MPRVIVTTDLSPLAVDASAWLDEHVHSTDLSADHAAAQFIERLAWAISDAEDTDREHADRRVRPSRQQRRTRPAPHSRSQPRVRA
jgi:hypothetical protein